MVFKFIVENFKSFNGYTELNLISSSKIRSKIDHRVKVGTNLKVLKHAVIYGANSSGKSNLIEALSFFITTVNEGLPINSYKLYCRNKEENKNRNSVFEIQMELDGNYYAYGFSAILSERKITEEWLYKLSITGSSSCIFERETNSKPIIGNGLIISIEEKNRFETYSSDFEDNNNSLFLSEMNRGKKLLGGLNVFENVYKAIKNNIVVIKPNSRFVNFQQYYNTDSLTEINEMISTFDTGVSDIRIEEIDISELERMVPQSVLQDILENLKARKNECPYLPARFSGRTNKAFFGIELENTGDIKINTIKMRHGNSICDFGFDEESDGTRRLFDLMDILLKKSDDTVFVVDELERSLHPKLTERFLELFIEKHKEGKAQLIFTTHEPSLMDLDLFRRDEIWFVERDNNNDSTLYPLDKFKERYDKKLSKAYLEGRYGAIPVFKRFEFKKEK